MMMICFFGSKEVVHKEFVTSGQTINQQFYLERLRKRVVKNTWILHHDNVLYHRASRNVWHQKNISVFPNPLYSPDIAYCDFFVVARIKQRTRFESATRVLQGLCQSKCPRSVTKTGKSGPGSILKWIISMYLNLKIYVLFAISLIT